MTVVTFLAELTAMGVLRTMTVDAVGASLIPRFHRPSMASSALQSLMRAVQSEFSFDIVIETP